MKKYPQRIWEIIVESTGELYDIDSAENMEFLKVHTAGSGHTDENTVRGVRENKERLCSHRNFGRHILQ